VEAMHNRETFFFCLYSISRTTYCFQQTLAQKIKPVFGKLHVPTARSVLVWWMEKTASGNGKDLRM